MAYDRRGEDRRRSGRRQESKRSDEEEELLASYLEDIAGRLRTACAHLSEAEFDELVRDIAIMKLRFHEIDRTSFGLPPRLPSTDE